MSVVVGVDPSLTSSGVAILRDGQPVHVSHHGFPRRGAISDYTRSRRIRRQQFLVHQAAMTFGKPDLVMIERPLTFMKSSEAWDRYELAQRIFGDFDWITDGHVVYVNNKTAKVWITGVGNAEKAEIVATVRDWWPDQQIANDDEADALGLAAIGAFHLGEPMPFEVKPRHTTGLEKVAWPVTA